MAILISNKAALRANNIIRDREEHHIIVKKSTHEEDIIILNVCEPNKKAAKFERRSSQIHNYHWKLQHLYGIEKPLNRKSKRIWKNSTIY